MKKKIMAIIYSLIFILSFTACKKLVEVNGPSTSVNSANVYEKDVTAASVLTGIYTNMSLAGMQSGSLPSMSYLPGLSSDELTLAPGLGGQTLNAYYTNTLYSEIAGSEFWYETYRTLYVVNAALEGLSESTTLTPAVKQQLSGEAKFMRAFCFFYLTNLYGNVPLTLNTNYKDNSLIPRSDSAQVWQQIITDLKDAQNLLSPDYLDATVLRVTPERVRPTKWAATALLSRVYLYVKDWENAEEEASAILENPAFGLVDLEDAFGKNNNEAIWQLQPVRKGSNTNEAPAFLLDSLIGPDDRRPAYLNGELVNSFDPGDQRKVKWTSSVTVNGITYPFVCKYKIINLVNDPNLPFDEYSTILRLAEQYLIRAEARIRQNKIADGIADLNVLRDRATDKTALQTLQLKPIPENLPIEDALLAVEHERRTELFTEWGHRWLDLKRTGRVDAIMAEEVPKKVPGGVWKSYQQWYPISTSELIANPRLEQNEGY